MKLFSISLIALVIISCNESPEDSRCENYCDNWTSAYVNEAEVYECSITDEDLNSFGNDCELACRNAYYSAQSVYTKNIDSCLDCINLTLDGTQRILDFDKILWNECQAECVLTTEFYASFFVSEPNCE